MGARTQRVGTPSEDSARSEDGVRGCPCVDASLGCLIAMTDLKGKTLFAGYYSNIRQTTIPSDEHALGRVPDWAG